MNNQTITNPVEINESVTVGTMIKRLGFVDINSKVAINTNGYPFLTFIDANNEAENIYFSKSAAELVKEGDEVDVEFLNQFQAVHISYDDVEKEDRWKLSLRGGNRVSVAAMSGLL